MYVWIVETKLKYQQDTEWGPCLGFPKISGIHQTRKQARHAAKKMYFTNHYNYIFDPKPAVYRIMKYIREEL